MEATAEIRAYFIPQLKTSERKALKELKDKLLLTLPASAAMWGVPLLSNSDERADVILLKFLQAREFKAQEALGMLVKCLAWRKEFGADALSKEELGGFEELDRQAAYVQGSDRDGHPVCYNAFGVFKDRELFEKVLGDEEKVERFLRWRVQVVERGIKLLNFKPGGVNSIIKVIDLKVMPSLEFRLASNRMASIFRDNYPGMVAKTIFINVPCYSNLMFSMLSPFLLTQRTKSKVVISKKGNDVAETLYKFISPEKVPVKYGGLSRPNDALDGPPKPASEFTIEGGEKANIEIEGIKGGATITWDLVVGGWELDYSAEFVPNAEGSYALLVERKRRMAANEEAIRNSFAAREAGKLVLSVDNTASRCRKVAAYRYVIRTPINM